MQEKNSLQVNYKILRPDPEEPAHLFWLDMEHKGVATTFVEIDNEQYRIEFYTAERAKHALDWNLENGNPCMAETYLVLVPDTTQSTIHASVKYLVETGFFKYILPIPENQRQFNAAWQWIEDVYGLDKP
jgi:hypothetical protein